MQELDSWICTISGTIVEDWIACKKGAVHCDRIEADNFQWISLFFGHLQWNARNGASVHYQSPMRLGTAGVHECGRCVSLKLLIVKGAHLFPNHLQQNGAAGHRLMCASDLSL